MTGLFHTPKLSCERNRFHYFLCTESMEPEQKPAGYVPTLFMRFSFFLLKDISFPNCSFAFKLVCFEGRGIQGKLQLNHKFTVQMETTEEK